MHLVRQCEISEDCEELLRACEARAVLAVERERGVDGHRRQREHALELLDPDLGDLVEQAHLLMKLVARVEYAVRLGEVVELLRERGLRGAEGGNFDADTGEVIFCSKGSERRPVG